MNDARMSARASDGEIDWDQTYDVMVVGGDQVWQGTDNLYRCPVPLVAPAIPGLHRWTARIGPQGEATLHREAQHSFSIASIPAPEHRLTVEVLNKARSMGLGQPHVRVGPYSATMDAQGRATLHVTAGDHVVQAWKPTFFAREERVHVKADTTVQLTTEVVSDKDPQYNRDSWI